MKFKLYVFSAICALTLISLYFGRDNSNNKIVETQSEIGKSEPFVSVAARPPATGAMNKPQSRNGLAEMMATSTNLRAFVDHALQFPEKGGVFLAGQALSDCRQSQKYLKASDAELMDMYAALKLTAPPNPGFTARNKLAARCSGFTAQDYALIEDLSLGSSGKLGNGRAPDPLVELEAQSRKNRDNPPPYSFDKAKETASLYSDLATFSAVGFYVFGVKQPGEPGLTVYFDGKPWGGYSKQAMWIAHSAIAQDADQALGETFSSLQACMATLQCEPQTDRIDRILKFEADTDRKMTPEKSAALKQEVMSLMPKLKQALESKNFDAFAPPKRSS
jgi:hypothetical protein